MNVKVGDVLTHIDPDYNKLRSGVKSIFIQDWVESGKMVFIKDRVVLAVLERNPEQVETLRAVLRESDGVICNSSDSPERVMGQRWTEAALAKAKRFMETH